MSELGRRWGGWKMDGYVKAFILSSLASLLLGATLGLTMAVHDALHVDTWSNWTWLLLPSHTHLMLVGWVSMMIFGVGYHMLPRFSGVLVWSARMAWWHWGAAVTGLAGMATGFWLDRVAEGRGAWLVAAGGTLEATGFVLFAVNLLVTLWIAGAPRAPLVPSGALPLADRLAARAAEAPPAA